MRTLVAATLGVPLDLDRMHPGYCHVTDRPETLIVLTEPVVAKESSAPMERISATGLFAVPVPLARHLVQAEEFEQPVRSFGTCHSCAALVIRIPPRDTCRLAT